MFRTCICGLLLAVIVFGCSRSNEGSRADRDLRDIRQSGILKWGSDEAGGAPYEFRDANNTSQRIGFEVEIADELVKRMKLRLEFVQTDWAALVPALERRDFDMAMAGIEVTEDRKQVVSFTKPYYIYRQQLVTTAENKAINSLTDCKGKKVGTLNNTAAERILRATPGIGEVVTYDDNVRPYEDCIIGRIDAVLLDLPIALYNAKDNVKLRFAGEPFGEGYYAIAVRKTSPGLLRALDQELDAMIKDGTLKRILEKWKLWDEKQALL